MKFLSVAMLCLVLTTGFYACQKGSDVPTNTGLAQSDEKRVAYGANAAQVMDVYLPAGRTTTSTKTIIFIHGGSWSGGDKADFDSSIAAIRGSLKDYAIFNINYRLANGGANQFPTQMTDIALAISFIEGKAAAYNINTDKVALIGASAGAHLALLQAYRYNSNAKIKAVINLFGPNDLTTLYNNHPIPAASQPVLVNFLGATPAANPSLYQQASPINYVTALSPATLILHGDVDFIVPVTQSIALRTKLQTAGVTVDMKTYPNEGHGWIGANLLDTHARAIAFIKANVK